jgi:hypothetical protein
MAQQSYCLSTKSVNLFEGHVFKHARLYTDGVVIQDLLFISFCSKLERNSLL